jgi:hypothetical protein
LQGAEQSGRDQLIEIVLDEKDVVLPEVDCAENQNGRNNNQLAAT